MKKTFVYLLILIFCAPGSFCIDKEEDSFAESARNNPGISLNPQDLPLFFEEDHPLTGMYTFNLIPPLALQNTAMQKNVQNLIKKELEKIGKIIHLKELDMRGMGAGNILNIQIGDVVGWDNNALPIARVSLQLETFVVINKTGIKTFPVIWSINTFFPGPTELSGGEALLQATQKIVQEFVRNYKYANQGKPQKPVFYTYY